MKIRGSGREGKSLLKMPFNYKGARIVIYVMTIVLVISLCSTSVSTQAQTDRPVVYTIVLDGTVEKGLHAFLNRVIEEAEKGDAAHILIDMNTYGGAVDAADQIGKLFQSTDIPITVFVNHRAISAGSFIALNADQIIMVPHASMGAAQVVDLEGNAGDVKAMSMWIKNMRSAAETTGRDPIYAEAMVDPSVVIEGLTEEGELLTFSASEALEYGYADALAANREEALAFLGLENAEIREVEISAAENIARFLTHPVVASILLSLASLGLVLELYSPGFGVPGTIGLVSLFLFFFGHLIAGFAGWESLILLVLGIGFIIFELLTPSFGIFGILGIAGVIISLTMASVDLAAGLRSIGIAVVVTVIVVLLLGKSLNKRGLWSKLILQEDLSTEEGNSRFEQRVSLIGRQGVTQTQLRPAGVAVIDGQRYDVVSEGTFIERDRQVEVILVEGPRIVVRGMSK